MAADLTQDSVLYFLQSRGGSVRNSELLSHFSSFLRDHEDRARHRDLFKKFVNSVATVKQEQGVSYVVLRKKFRGPVPGDSSGAAGRKPDISPRTVNPNPEKKPQWPPLPQQKAPHGAATAPVPPGDLSKTGKKTVLPSAGIILNNNNNNVETSFNLNLEKPRQVSSPHTQELVPYGTTSTVPGSANGPKTLNLSVLTRDQRGSYCPPLNPPPPVSVREHGAVTRPEGPEASLKSEDVSQQEVRGTACLPQITPCRARHRQSYKTALSHDDDEEEDEEEEEEQQQKVSRRPGSSGGLWPLNAPLGQTGNSISTSSPCISDPPAPPSLSSSDVRDRSGGVPGPRLEGVPTIYIQGLEGERLLVQAPEWSSAVGQAPGLALAPGGWKPGRHSLPLEAERCSASLGRAEDAEPHSHHSIHRAHQHAQFNPPSKTSLDPGLGPRLNPGVRLSSSHSSIMFSSSGSGWNSNEELHTREGEAGGGARVQEMLQRAKETKRQSVLDRVEGETSAPWHHSTGSLLDDQESAWHHSTGHLYDDCKEVESSEGSTSSQLLRPAVARQLSSKLRSRMCRSLGADLDKQFPEEVRGGSEAARLNRLHLLSSSLSLHHTLSSSSLSSCSTPPRSHSLRDLAEGGEGSRGGGRRRSGLPASSTAHHDSSYFHRQSLVPLEPREHAWLVKGAAAAWADIYSLFRDDPSLLNRRDFVSGFTVLHWIAKHGDHRVLNTLWYGVDKAGLTLDVDARSACGYTPLHLAAIHGHKKMMRLLVLKFKADVGLRDTAGKKPWQYLGRAGPRDLLHMLGAPQGAGGEDGGAAGGGRKSRRGEGSWYHHRHHHSSSSSAEKHHNRPITVSGSAGVKRSSSIAAFLKHKSLRRFHGHQSDSSV